MRRRSSGLVPLVLLLACTGAGAFGHFVGSVKSEWIDPDRRMRLLDDFAYVDRSGVEWKAPKESVINGASIPRALWTVVGSPFTGEYRNASVVHDVACDRRDRPWRDVHRMFYDACRCGGVGEQKAKLMYAAVFHFGPQWTTNGTLIVAMRTKPIEEELKSLQVFVESTNPSLEAIEKFVPPGDEPPG